MFDLCQIVETPTRDRTILDLVFLSHSIFTTRYECKVIDGISDSILVNLKVSAHSPSGTVYLVHDFNNADNVAVLDELGFPYEEFEQVFAFTHAGSLWKVFCTIVEHCRSDSVPLKHKNKNVLCPGMNREILHLSSRFQELRGESWRTGDSIKREIITALETTKPHSHLQRRVTKQCYKRARKKKLCLAMRGKMHSAKGFFNEIALPRYTTNHRRGTIFAYQEQYNS